MSLRRHSKLDSKERAILDSFERAILPRDTEQKILQLKAAGNVVTMTAILDIIVVLMLCEHQKKVFQVHKTMISILNSFRQHERDCFYTVICRLALVQTQGHVLNQLELSNQLLSKGYGCLGDVNLYGLIDVRTEHQQLEYVGPAGSNSFSFVNVNVQHFLAAINLLKLPLMEIFQFIKNFTLAERIPQVSKNSSIVLQFFFGLAKSIFGDNSTALLQNVLKFLTQHINRDSPVVDSRVSILILNCLYEAQDTTLYRQVQNETFLRQIFSYEPHIIEANLESFAHYLSNTSESKQALWTVYCSSRHKPIAKKLVEIKGSPVQIKTNSKLSSADPKRIVISNKNFDYLVSVLTDTAQDSPLSSISHERRDSLVSNTSTASTDSASSIAVPSESTSSMLSHSLVSLDTLHTLPSQNTSDCLSGPYGYLTKEQFESGKKAQTTFYYNMVKDFVTPNLQMHCATLVRTQYRKNDHIWFSFPPTMRHNFYECVEMTPVIPMHWVKVRKPLKLISKMLVESCLYFL